MTFKPQAWSKLTPESYPRLYEFLDPRDRRAAMQELEKIRVQLTRMFQSYGADDPEVLAHDTIDRAAVQCEKLTGPCVGPPFPFFRAFAKHVFQESLRERYRTQPLPLCLPAPEPDLEDQENKELMDRCLEQCLASFSDANRELVLGYYLGEKRAKIEHRKELAEQLKVPLNALRIRVCRLRAVLRKCVLECVEARSAV